MKDLKSFFITKFGEKPKYQIKIPSRVNLIGEHVDYHESFVLPMAIDNIGMTALITPRSDQKIRMFSDSLAESDQPFMEFSISDNRSKIQWVQYVQGAIAQFAEEYGRRNLKGFDLLIESSIPIGGGLSSSSALTMVSLAACGLANNFSDGEKDYTSDQAIKIINEKSQNLKTEKLLKKLCLMGCWAEYWYGTRGGAMDHFALTVSKKGSAILLDHRSFDYKYINLPENLSILVLNTMVRHNQLYSGFGVRRIEANEGFKKLQKYYPEAKTVRDLSFEQVVKYKSKLSDREFRRLKHPTEEKGRVFDFVEALKNQDFQKAGETMNLAFLGLKDDYEVSCLELNIMQKAAVQSPGCFGARITGGGFGGCIVALVDRKDKEQFIKSAKEKYDNNPKIKKLGIKSEIWEAHSGNGLIVEKI